jgi:hypothetical protein
MGICMPSKSMDSPNSIGGVTVSRAATSPATGGVVVAFILVLPLSGWLEFVDSGVVEISAATVLSSVSSIEVVVIGVIDEGVVMGGTVHVGSAPPPGFSSPFSRASILARIAGAPAARRESLRRCAFLAMCRKKEESRAVESGFSTLSLMPYGAISPHTRCQTSADTVVLGSGSHDAMELESTACGAELGVGELLGVSMISEGVVVTAATFSVPFVSSAPTPAGAGRVGRHSESMSAPLAAAAASEDQPRWTGFMR